MIRQSLEPYSNWKRGVWRWMIVASFLPLSIAQAGAQGFSSLELVVFGGYRWSNALTNVNGVSKFDVRDAAVFGATLDVNVSSDAALELYWSHLSADWETTRQSGEVRTGSLRRDDFLLGGVWYAPTPGRVGRLDLSAGFGVAVFSSDAAETTGRLAWSLGVGMRRNVLRRVGLRGDFRWAPAYLPEGGSFWCDSFDCYPLNSGTIFSQWELSAGLILEIGGR